MARFPHGGEILGAAPANPLLAPVLRPGRDLNRQQAMLDLAAIQRIPGLAGYWPADPAYIYQDSAGTIAASVGGVVGLSVDASKGLATGSSTITNSDFMAGSDGWGVVGADGTHKITFSTGSVRYQSGTVSPVLYLAQANAFTPAALNILTITVSASNGGNMTFNNNGGTTAVDVSVGTRSVIFKAGAVESFFNFYRGKVDQDVTFTSIDIKPLLGNHAYQTTTANKPYLRKTSTSGVHWLDSNTDTSALTATLGNLGSSCTVAQAGAEGVTFTEGVTISSTYNIAPTYEFNGDVAIFNRALTVTEKALLTRYMQRGVPVLGSNLVTNGTFDTNTVGWTAIGSPLLTVNNGVVNIANNGAAYTSIYQLTLNTAKAYTVAASARGAGAVPRLVLGANIGRNGTTSTEWQNLACVGFPSGSFAVSLLCNSGTASGVGVDFDNVTVKEIL